MARENPGLARTLVLDELFDLTLYKRLHQIARGDLRKILEDLIPVETRHLAFWQDFFSLDIHELDFGRRLKLQVLATLCRLFGANTIHLVLEAIEIYGVRKYLNLWEAYKGGPLGDAVQGILADEFKHEDAIVSRISQRLINPERIRSIFLGFNDGLVEILGAVSGFFAAFGHAGTVLVASFTVAMAGALSMAAGAFVAGSSEREVTRIELGKKRFLGEAPDTAPTVERPLLSATLVGIGYLLGAVVPVLPLLLGASSVLASVLAAGAMIILLSLVLAFLSGMEISRRIFTNLVILAAAVGVTYALGLVAKRLWGIEV